MPGMKPKPSGGALPFDPGRFARDRAAAAGARSAAKNATPPTPAMPAKKGAGKPEKQPGVFGRKSNKDVFKFMGQGDKPKGKKK